MKTHKSDHPQQIHMDGSTRQQKLYDESIELLRLACPPEGYYLATSFGKDSIVAQRLCDEAGVKYDAHHNITGIDPPELVYFGRKHYPTVERHKYSMSMWALIRKHGVPPMRNMRYCCEVLKEGGGIGRTCVMGLRASESKRREDQWGLVTEWSRKREKNTDLVRMLDNDDVRDNIQACSAQGKIIVSPLYRWNADDLWAFICDRNLPYCELYDQGFLRLGCIGCPMSRTEGRLRDFARWPDFRRLYIRAFNELVKDGRFYKRGIRSGEELMYWWMQDRIQEKTIDGQLDIWMEDDA